MDSVRLSEQKDALLKRLADTEGANAVSLKHAYPVFFISIDCNLRSINKACPASPS